MNLNLADVVCTSKDGDQFWKLNECYVRGSSIKYLRLPEEAVERVDESEEGRWKGGGRGGRELLTFLLSCVTLIISRLTYTVTCCIMARWTRQG